MMRKVKYLGLLGIALGTIAVATAQTAVDSLRDAGGMSFRLINGNYSITLGIDCSVGFASGTLGTQLPLNIQFGEHGSGTGLDFRISIRQIVNAIHSDALVTFHAQVINSNEVKWTANESFNPVICTLIFIGGSPNLFEIGRVFGTMRFQIAEGGCVPDPLNMRGCASLTLTPVGGNAENNLNFDGFAPIGGSGPNCAAYPVHVPACARANTLQLVAYGGGHPDDVGDVNRDCVVDDSDLLAVLFAFGQNGPNMPEDINGDEAVDDSDLLIVLFNFGAEC